MPNITTIMTNSPAVFYFKVAVLSLQKNVTGTKLFASLASTSLRVVQKWQMASDFLSKLV